MSQETATPSSTPLYRQWHLWLLLAGLVTRVALALAPLRWLMAKVVPDDSFMYWQVARNILTGHGASLDGVNPTTAYHPLWMLPTLGVMALFDNGGDLPVHVSLVLSGVLDMVTAWLVWKAALLITKDGKAALTALVLYLINPYMTGFAVSGLGDGLNSLLVLAYFYLYWRVRAEERDESTWWIAMGLVAGLAMLARTDSVFFHLAILFHLLLSRPAENLWDRLRPPLLVGLASCVPVVPWLLYVHHLTGHFEQTSGISQPYVNHALLEGRPLAEKLEAVLGNFIRGVSGFARTAGFGAVLAALVLLAAGRRAGTEGEEREMLRRWRVLLLLPFIGLAALVFTHGAIRWSVRQWYFFPSTWALALVLAVLWRAHSRKLGPVVKWIVVVLLVLGIGESAHRTWYRGFYPHQIEMYDMAYYVRENLPKEDKPVIGGFNILAQAYYNPNQIMNLDGIGNEEAMRHIQKRDLAEYVDEVGLKYIIDYAGFIRARYAMFLGGDFFGRLQPLVHCPAGPLIPYEGNDSHYTLYKILPPGQEAPPGAPPPVACEPRG